MNIKKLALLLALTAASSGAIAGQNRQGFIIGLGIGPSNLEVQSDTADDSYSGTGTSFMLGGGVNDQFTIYYVSDVVFFTRDTTDDFGDTNSDLWAAGLAGIGLSYYFSPDARSAYIGGAFGLSSMTDVVDSSISSYSGNGFSLTLGFEFARHFNVELNLIRSSMDNEDDSSDTLDLAANRVLFKWLWY